MKVLLNICMVAIVLAVASPAVATVYTVDLGTDNTISTDGGTPAVFTNLSDWGEAESGGGAAGRGVGTYGGIGVGNCRMVWGNGGSGDTTAYASITFPEDVASITIRHLNGKLNDSYDIHVDGVYWDHYAGFEDGECWYTDTYSGTPGSVLMITATIEDYNWRIIDDWGQLAIDWVAADTVPEPATIILLSLGGMLLRKKR